MSITRWDPFGELMSLREAMNRLFEESFVRPATGLLAPEARLLPVDVYQTANDVVVKAAIPGVKPEEVDITISGDVVCIKGETKSESEVKEADYFRQERRFGTFYRELTLPVATQPDKAEATFENGVLTLTIPKAEEIKPKAVKIKTRKE